MTLATKNGSIIVKDGALAEDCGCCGGWYCCPEPACFSGRIASVTATLTVDDYLRHTQTVSSRFDGTIYKSFAIPGSLLSRQYALTSAAGGSSWVYTANDCRDATISFSVAPLFANQYAAAGSATFFSLSYYSENSEQYKNASQMLCDWVCTGSQAVFLNGKYRNGTYKCDRPRQNDVYASVLIGQCDAVPQTVLSGVANVLLPPTHGYSSDEKDQSTVTTVVSAVGPESPKASLRFDVTVS